MRPEMGDAISGLAGGVIRDADADTPRPPSVSGAVHSADIEYFMGNLDTNTVYAWDADDIRVSAQMQQIYVNFVTHGNPNGAGIPTWPALQPGAPAQLLHIDAASRVITDPHQLRYQFLDTFMH
jgi:para-nitrobenzyl esterase